MDEEELEQVLMHLYELGLVSVEYDENLTARFRITDEGQLELFLRTLEGNIDDV